MYKLDYLSIELIEFKQKESFTRKKKEK
jgi:hypothetical protein